MIRRVPRARCPAIEKSHRARGHGLSILTVVLAATASAPNHLPWRLGYDSPCRSRDGREIGLRAAWPRPSPTAATSASTPWRRSPPDIGLPKAQVRQRLASRRREPARRARRHRPRHLPPRRCRPLGRRNDVGPVGQRRAAASHATPRRPKSHRGHRLARVGFAVPLAQERSRSRPARRPPRSRRRCAAASSPAAREGHADEGDQRQASPAARSDGRQRASHALKRSFM